MRAVIFVLLYLPISFQENLNIQIKSEIDFCTKTVDAINLDNEFKQYIDIEKRFICNSLLNTLDILRYEKNNEFKLVFTSYASKVFYFSEFKIFDTICVKLQDFEVVESPDECTRDLLVNFRMNGSEIKNEIVKNSRNKIATKTASGKVKCPLCNNLYLKRGLKIHLKSCSKKNF